MWKSKEVDRSFSFVKEGYAMDIMIAKVAGLFWPPGIKSLTYTLQVNVNADIFIYLLCSDMKVLRSNSSMTKTWIDSLEFIITHLIKGKHQRVSKNIYSNSSFFEEDAHV